MSAGVSPSRSIRTVSRSISTPCFPIPQRVLRKGFAEAGQEWMWANWGVWWPIRPFTLEMEQRRLGRTGMKTVATFRFLL